MLMLGVPSGGTAAENTPPVVSSATTCIHATDPGFQAQRSAGSVAMDPGFSVAGSGRPDPGFSVRLPVCK